MVQLNRALDDRLFRRATAANRGYALQRNPPSYGCGWLRALSLEFNDDLVTVYAIVERKLAAVKIGRREHEVTRQVVGARFDGMSLVVDPCRANL